MAEKVDSCSMSQNEAKLVDNKRRYREFVDGLIARLGGECNHCGSSDSLEFDHVDWRTKVFTITTNWYIKDRVLFESELAKCQLLCASCHKVKTAKDLVEQRQEDVFTHGTLYGWMKRKCECDTCASAKRDWYDARNEKRRGTSGVSIGPYKQPAEHGTSRMYKRGCKCDACKAANAAKAREAAGLKRQQSLTAS